MIISLRSWMNVSISKVHAHWTTAATAALAEGENKILETIVQQLEEEQSGWNEKIFEDVVIFMLQSQSFDIVFDAKHDFGFD